MAVFLYDQAAAATPARISESPNPLTQDIDICDPLGIVRLLRQSDGQMFTGYGPWEGVLDSRILESIAKVGVESTGAVLT